MDVSESKRRWVLRAMVFIIPVVAAGGCTRGQAAKLPDPEVLVAPAAEQDVRVHEDWAATLDGYVNADIRPRVSGSIIKQHYQEGSVVRAGQVLFQIDPRSFEIALENAKAQLARAEALLRKSVIDAEGETALVPQIAVAKGRVEDEMEARRAAEAAVASGKAAVERARLELGWTQVTSLVDGVAGIAQVVIGNLVGPATSLTWVSRVDPIKAYFSVSEQEYLRANHLSSTAEPMNLFGGAPELILADGTLYPHRGNILATDRQVDPNTGTIRFVATFPNPGNVLRPGQRGRVRIDTSTNNGRLSVPRSAVKDQPGVVHRQKTLMSAPGR